MTPKELHEMTVESLLESLEPLAYDFKEKLEKLIDLKIEAAMENIDSSQDADDIRGLRDFVQGIVEDHTPSIDASDISNLDDAISEAVGNLTFKVSVS